MAGNGKLILLLGLFWMLSNHCWSQTIWADVALDKRTVYVGQPVGVSVKVYTSTWFTTGVDLGNIKVQGAFSVYFRPVSTSFQKDGKMYSGVELIYNVFPFETGKVTFPALDIEVNSPAPGEYKGSKHTVKTEEKTIHVKPAPASFSSEEWLVASGLSVSDSWSGDVQQVKVGDVLERKITRTAFGTVSELIPPITWDTLTGVSEYASRSVMNNQKDKTAISATRTERMRYLFEKEGEITMPEMVFTWFDPTQEKLYKRTLKAVTVQVAANPDLGVLASIRDSLALVQEAELAEKSTEKERTILGMGPKRFAILGLILLGSLIFLYVIIRKLIQHYHQKHEAYLQSEKYFWDRFVTSYRKGDKQMTLGLLYRWLDELNLAEPTVAYFVRGYGSPKLKNAYQEGAASGKLAVSVLMDDQISDWKHAREAFLSGNKGRIDKPSDWINP